MARKRARIWESTGVLWTVGLGMVLHFLYGWSGRQTWIAALAAVNESTWEHMKLLAVPWILWSVAEALGLRGRHLPVMWSRCVGLLSGLVAVPVLFYTYTGVVGRHFLWADITTFVLAVITGTAVSLRGLNRWRQEGLLELAGGLILAAALAAVVVWTWAPPEIGLFLDPVTHRYGVVME